MKCYYLTQDHTTKLTPVEEKIATHVMKRKFSLSKDNIATLKTGGQPLHVVKVTKARKSSLDASVRVTKKRTNEIEHFRRQTAGKTTAASEAQQIHELKKLTIGKRERICQAS